MLSSLYNFLSNKTKKEMKRSSSQKGRWCRRVIAIGICSGTVFSSTKTWRWLGFGNVRFVKWQQTRWIKIITGALRSRVSSVVGGAVKSKLLIVTPHEVEPSLGVLRHELHL